MISAIIPTTNRFAELATTLAALTSAEQIPDEILVVGIHSFPIPATLIQNFPIQVFYESNPSAAKQRNLGARKARGNFLLFVDDDITPRGNALQLLAQSLDDIPGLAAVAGHMEGSSHSRPGRLLNLYYRLQAGYSHPDYSAQIFGPAITTFPCYKDTNQVLIESKWLNSACVLYRKELFTAHHFPEFEGYSPFEDAYLSASIARTHRLAFHRNARYQHRGIPGASHSFRAGRMFIENLRATATDVLGMHPFQLGIKLGFHKLFIILHLVRGRPTGWFRHATGILLS